MKLFLDFLGNIYNNRKLLIVFIFLTSIFCSLIFLIFFSTIGLYQHREPPGDYLNWYEPIANNILQGKGITFEGKVFRNIPPGFSVILSGIFLLSDIVGIDKIDLIIAFNIFLTALSSCLLFLIAQALFNKKIALIASFLWMSYPFSLWFLKQPHTEVPFIFLLYAGILFYILALKRKDLKFVFFGGITLGLASLVRLVGIFFPVFLALLTFLLLRDHPKRKQFLFAMVLLLGNLIAVFPWLVYTFSATGGISPISENLGAVGCFVYGITVLTASMDHEGKRPVFSEDVVFLIERLKSENPENLSELFQFFAKESINEPTALLKLIGLKLARSWYATSQQWWEGKILMVQLLYLITGFGGLIYTIRTDRNKIRDIIFILSIIFYFWIIAFFNVSILRYLVPVMALVIIFSAILANFAVERLSKKIGYHSL